MTSEVAPPVTLQELYRRGELVARYPEVPSLLAAATDDDMIVAGQLLSRLTPDEIRAAHPNTPTLSVAITGYGTLAQLVAPLTAECARHGLLTRPQLGDFGGYVSELGDPDSALYRAEWDLVLCVLDPMVIFDEVPVPWRPEDVEQAASAKIDMITGLAARFRETSRGTLVLNTIPLPRRFSAQLADHASRARLSEVWRHANAQLLRLAGQDPSVVVIDLEPLIGEGIPVVDPRMSVYAKAHLSAQLLARYGREIAHLARHVTGRTKKLLAVDLDETVWGGVLGEDGPDGVEVAGSYRGEAFRTFQKVVKQIGSQGVLLAAVSKNDAEPVAAVLRDHPEMTLREDDFIRVLANWQPKHDNLTQLAEALNVGLDSLVFVDDSSFECGLVRHSLPGVAVVQLSTEPAEHVGRLLRDGWFDSRELTTEDRARTSRYRDELARKDFLDSFTSLEDYLLKLGVTVRLAGAEAADVARVSQLTLRTNQFNMTTRRLQQPDIEAMLTDPAASVLTIRSADRFGDNGLVGAILAHRTGEVLHIDNFLLSCRVFARGIEQTCLSALLRHAQRTGLTEVRAEHQLTAKNGKVADFYPRNGFLVLSEEDGHRVFRHDLADPPAFPEHVQLIESIGDNRP